jgi:hydroxyacylglutathione hydrolase
VQVYENIFLLDGIDFDSNIYIIDGELLIDTGTGLFFKEVKKEILDLGYDKDKIKTIINTHAHYDHVGGNSKFRDWLGAKILAHGKDADLIETGKTFADLFDKKPEESKIDKRLSDGDIIRTKNFEFKVIHTPGHSPGSICLYDKVSGVLISGDTVFSEGIGRTDLPGGSMDDMINSLRTLSKLKINYIFPGHGEIRDNGIDVLFKQLLTRYTR